MTSFTSDEAFDFGEPTLDPARPLRASGNLRRRHFVSRLVMIGANLAAFFAVAVMFTVLWTVASRGAGAITWSFLTTAPPQFGGPGGGIAPALVGTALIVAVATAIAMPLGVLVALFTTEFASPRQASFVKAALDLMNGLPTIVVGIFAFGLLVVGHGQSGFAGSVALAIVMVPLIARAAQEALRRVPVPLREGAAALGVGRRKTVTGVVIPTAMPGIITGTILAVARAAGETAPLLFVTSIYAGGFEWDFFHKAVPNIPVTIFTLSEAADPTGFTRAWGAALILLLFILVTNIAARTLFARSQVKTSR